MLDKDKPYTIVGGKRPLCFMQDGHGFDAAGNDLGRYDAQGEPEKAADAPVAQPEKRRAKRGRPPKSPEPTQDSASREEPALDEPSVMSEAE